MYDRRGRKPRSTRQNTKPSSPKPNTVSHQSHSENHTNGAEHEEALRDQKKAEVDFQNAEQHHAASTQKVQALKAQVAQARAEVCSSLNHYKISC